MKFDNEQFEKNCKETMSTLDKLKEKLHSTKSASGLSELGEAAKDLGLSQVEKSLDSVNKKMSILGVAGATVVSELTKKAMEFAHTVTTAVPKIIKEGGWTRAMNIEQAKFQLEGLGIAWAQVGEQISNAVSGTAYSMDSAAKAASQLAASGVEISGVGDQMERSLKAISGVAAQTNSSYDDIANIFTTIAGNGRLMGDQLRQFSTRGMNAAAALGKAMGATEAEVRDMVSKGQISFEQFSEIMYETFGENAFKANQTFTGAMDNMRAALKRTGEAFAGPIIRQTIPVFNALRESINKANKEVFKFSSNNVTEQSKYSDAVKQAKEELEDLTNSYYSGTISIEEYRKESARLNGVIKENEQALEDCYGPFEKLAKAVSGEIVSVIKEVDWKFLNKTFQGFINLGKAAYSVVKPLGQAFLDVFGITTKGINKSLQDFANSFAKFTEKLILSTEEMDYLKRAFRGVISVFSIAKTLFMQVLSAILGVNVETGDLRKNVLKFVGTIGDMLFIFSEWIKESHALEFVLRAVSKVVYSIIGLAAVAVANIIDLVNYIRKTHAFQTVLNTFKNILTVIVGSIVLLAQKIKYIFEQLKQGNISVLGPIGKVIEFIKDGVLLLVGAIGTAFEKISQLKVLSPIIDKVTAAFDKLKDVVYAIFGKKKGTDVISIADDEVPKGIQATGDAIEEAGNNVEKAGGQFGLFTGVLDSFSTSLTASRIAAGLFVGSILMITYKVANALEGFGKGVKSIGQFANRLSKGGIVGMILGTGDRTANKTLDTAIAIGILAASLLAIAKLPKDELSQAGEALTKLVVGFSGMMIIFTYLDNMTGTLGGLSNITKAMIEMTAAITGLAIAASILSKFNWSDLIKGMTGIAVAGAELVTMAIAMAKWAPAFEVAAGSMIGLSLSIDILTIAFKRIANMETVDWGVLIQNVGQFAIFTGILVGVASFAKRLGGNSSFLRLSSSILMFATAFGIIVWALDKIDLDALTAKVNKWREFLTGDWTRLLAAVALAIGGVAVIYALIKTLPILVSSIIGGIRTVLSRGQTATEEVKRTVDYMGMAINKLGIAAIILSITASMIALAGLFLVISKVVKNFSKEDMFKAAGIIAGLTVIVSALMYVAKMTSGAKPTAILSSILAIGVILGAIYAMGIMLNADMAGAIAGFVGVLAIMGVWATMMAFMSKIDYKPSTYKGLVAAVAGIGVAVYGIVMLADAFKDNAAGYIAAVVSMGALIVAFTGIIAYLGKSGYTFTKSKLTGMMIAVGALVAIGASLSAILYFAKDTESILAAMAAMAVVASIFGTIANNLSTATKNPAVFAAFGGIALMAVSIGATLALMANSIQGKHDDLIAASLAISGVAMIFAMIASTASDITNAVDVFVTLSALALSAIGFATAISILTKHPWENILIALGSLVGAAVIFGVIAGILGAPAIGEFVSLGAINLDLIAVALVGISLAASIFISAITGLLPILKDFITTIFGTVVDNRDKLAETGAALIPFAAGLAAVGAAGLVLSLGNAGLIYGAVGISSLSVALDLLSKVDLNTLAINLDKITVPLLKFGLVGAALGTVTGLLVAAGAGFAALGVGVGLAMQAITDKAAKQLETVPKKMYEVGVWIPRSLSRGMESSKSEAIDTAIKLAKAIEEKIRNVLQIHSNSPLFNEIGEWIPKSMTTGIDSGMGNMLNSVGLDMSQLISSLDASSDTYSSGYNTGYNYGEGVKAGVAEGWKGLGYYINQFTTWLGGANKKADQIANKNKDDRTVDQKNAGTYRGVAGPSLLTQKKNDAKKANSPIDDITKSLGDFSKAAGGAGKAASSAEKSVTDLSGAFSTFSKSQKVSLKDMMNNLVVNYKETANWAADINILMSKGLNKDITDWIKQMGVGGHETVKAFMNASEEEVKYLNTMLPEYLSMDEKAQEILNGKYDLAASEAMRSFTNGLQTYNTSLAETIQNALDPFSKFDTTTEMTSREVLDNMQSQLKGMRQWGDNVNSLVGRVSEDILQYIYDLGPQSYDLVNAMAHMSDEQIKQMNELYDQQLSIGREIAIKNAEKYKEVGQSITDGLVSGLDFSVIAQQGTNIGTEMLDKTKQALDIHSPSGVYRDDIAKNTILGLRNGIKAYANLAYTALQEMARHSIKVTYQILNEEAGEEIGMFLMRGLERGIRSGKSGVINTIADMARSVIEAAYAAFEINSPSHVFQRIGFGLPEGLGLGVDKGTGIAVEAIDNMADTTINRMNEVIEAISQGIDGEFEDIDPVITPHLNLEELQNGRSLINRIFGAGPGLELSESIAADNNVSNVNNSENNPEQPVTNNQTIIFNQTNNSPKNIDPYESYRLNRLAAEQMKGAFA